MATASADDFIPQAARPCSFPGCTKSRRGGGLCSGHWNQQSRGKQLTPLRPGHAKPDSPRFESELARVVEKSATMTTRQLAADMGVSISRVIFLRYRARLRGHTLERIKESPRPEPELRHILKGELHDHSDDGEPRCRCGLRLPCYDCLPDIAFLATSRCGPGRAMPEPGGATLTNAERRKMTSVAASKFSPRALQHKVRLRARAQEAES